MIKGAFRKTLERIWTKGQFRRYGTTGNYAGTA
jgi:hypothetical protein